MARVEAVSSVDAVCVPTEAVGMEDAIVSQDLGSAEPRLKVSIRSAEARERHVVIYKVSRLLRKAKGQLLMGGKSEVH